MLFLVISWNKNIISTMGEDDHLVTLKILIIGESDVGKSR